MVCGVLWGAGVHELCFLTNPIQCQVGKHRLKSRKCLAFKTLEAYNEWKVRTRGGRRGGLWTVGGAAAAHGVLFV